MSFSKQRALQFSLSVIAISALVACGGGGGDDSGSTGSIGSSSTVSNQIALVTSVPVPTYDAETASVFNYINRQRGQCGLGLLSQNSKLDTAATNHSNYINLNADDSHPHNETPGNPGFTGVSPHDRITVAGYLSTTPGVGESGSRLFFSGLPELGPATRSVEVAVGLARNMASAPFHSSIIFGRSVDIGIGYVLQPRAVGPTYVPGSVSVAHTMYVNTAYGAYANGQQPAAGTGVRTFPCEGSTDLTPALGGEWLPTGPLVAGREMTTNPIGHPIMVFAEAGRTLTLSNATIINTSTGASVPILALRTKASDTAHSSLYSSDGFGYILPDTPLTTNTRYSVTIAGTEGGKAFTRSFSFTTGGYSAAQQGWAQLLGLK